MPGIFAQSCHHVYRACLLHLFVYILSPHDANAPGMHDLVVGPSLTINTIHATCGQPSLMRLQSAEPSHYCMHVVTHLCMSQLSEAHDWHQQLMLRALLHMCAHSRKPQPACPQEEESHYDCQVTKRCGNWQLQTICCYIWLPEAIASFSVFWAPAGSTRYFCQPIKWYVVARDNMSCTSA